MLGASSATGGGAQDPMMGAEDALNKTRGEGDFYEHLWSLDAVSDKYETDVDLKDPRNSKGLTSQRAEELL